MVTVVEEVTEVVVMVNGLEVWVPAGTVTEAGTAAMAGMELVKVRVSPPGGAGPFICTTLPGSGDPPRILAAESCTAAGVAGFTVNCACLVTP